MAEYLDSAVLQHPGDCVGMLQNLRVHSTMRLPTVAVRFFGGTYTKDDCNLGSILEEVCSRSYLSPS